jgi:DNA-binding transcriptional LysR family regulator
VAKAGSISRAARELHISQPSVSAQVREFEQRCRVDLLARRPRGVSLTNAGRVIFEHAERIFALAHELQTACHDLQGTQAGRLTIGGSLTAGEYFLPVIIGRFKADHPAIEPVVVLNNSTAIITQVSQRELDLGFIGTEAVGGDLVTIPCWQDEVVIIAPPGACSPDQPTMSFASLRSQTFVMREQGSATRQSTEEYLKRHGLAVKSNLTVGSPEAVKRHVAAGLGWGFASRGSVTEEVAAGRLMIVPIKGWDCRRIFYATHRKDHRLNLCQKKFLEIAQSIEI